MRKTVIIFAVLFLSAIAIYKFLFYENKPNMNIIYIVSDCLRADRLGQNTYQRDITPFLDKIALKGTSIKNTYAHSSWTLPSMVSHLTGINPTAAYKLSYGVSSDLNFISEILSDKGYNTYMISASPLLTRKWNFIQGFDVYEYIDSRDGRDVNAMISELLSKGIEEPFFLYIHYMDPHTPYYPPEEFLEKINPSAQDISIRFDNLKNHGLSQDELQAGIDSYDGEVLYQDHLISQIYNLINRNTDNKNLYVITADHGDEFSEHGGTGHGVTLYNEVIKVPLVIHSPGIVPEGLEIERPAQVIDIVPTILDICSIGYDEHKYEGSSIFSDSRGSFESFAVLWKTADPCASIISEDWKYIHIFEGEDHELYNLKDDPGEQDNLIEVFPGIAENLKGRLLDYNEENAGIYDYPDPLGAHKKGSDETRLEERIKALGYIL